MAKDIGNSLQVSIGSSIPTYKLTANDIAPVTSSFDIFNIANPATSTVALIPTYVYVAMDATAASTMDIYMVRRTAANTGGTPVSITYNAATSALGGSVSFQAHDTNDGASNAVINAYSANPTYGSGLTVDAGHLTVPAAATPGVPFVPWIQKYYEHGAKPIIIRPGQFFSLSFGGQSTPAGASMYLVMEWIEVPLMSLF